MNEQQVKGQIRVAVIGLAGLIGGWFAAKGYITAEQLSGIINSPVVAALATMAAGAVWSWFTHTKENAVAVVNAMPEHAVVPREVAEAITTLTPAGVKLANSLPDSPTVTPAGSVARST